MNSSVQNFTRTTLQILTETGIMVTRRCSAVPFASARFFRKTEAAMAPFGRSEIVCPSGLSAQLAGGESTIIISASQRQIL